MNKATFQVGEIVKFNSDSLWVEYGTIVSLGKVNARVRDDQGYIVTVRIADLDWA
jgi:hypothetical protein